MKVSYLLVAALLSCAGCAMTEAQIEAREYRRVDFEEQFRAYRRECAARGGRIYIDAKQSLTRDGVPHRGDRFYCS